MVMTKQILAIVVGFVGVLVGIVLAPVMQSEVTNAGLNGSTATLES